MSLEQNEGIDSVSGMTLRRVSREQRKRTVSTDFPSRNYTPDSGYWYTIGLSTWGILRTRDVPRPSVSTTRQIENPDGWPTPVGHPSADPISFPSDVPPKYLYGDRARTALAPEFECVKRCPTTHSPQDIYNERCSVWLPLPMVTAGSTPGRVRFAGALVEAGRRLTSPTDSNQP